MRYATLCSGIGAPEVAFSRLGWECAYQSEIEPFPCAVLAHHWPHVPNHGDMTRWTYWPPADLDLVVAGTPCQAFSVAGLRDSLADLRGSLTLEFARYVNTIRPRFVLWENVPGVLNTQDNAFGCFLGALAGSDAPLLPAAERWTGAGFVSGPKRQIAWRILDAQYFGLAQRRRRVFVLAGDLERGAGNWACARALFLERESMRGDIEAGAEARKEVARPLRARANHSHREDSDNIVVGSVSSKWAKGTGGPSGDECQNLVATLTKNYANNYGRTAGNNGGIAENQLIASFKCGAGSAAGSIGFSDALSPTLGSADSGTNRVPGLLHKSSVRRLTPRECERLQGFPDDHTLVNYRGKPASDSPRYKAIGNSMAVPVLEWIGKNLKELMA